MTEGYNVVISHFFAKNIIFATISKVNRAENENKKIEQNLGENGKKNVDLFKSSLISFAFDLGFAIIIPLVIFALGGRLLDKKFETSPLFLIVGLVISLVFTSISVYKKTKKFTK